MTVCRDNIVVQLNTKEDTDFKSIVTSYQRQVVMFAYRMLGNFEDARDHAQEAFVRLWKMNVQTRDNGQIFALLTRICMNLCIDTLRKKQRFHFFSISNPRLDGRNLKECDPARKLDNDEIKSLIESAVMKLKPKQKAVFILRDMEGRSVREAADIINCSENNVLVNLHLARKNLRKWMASYLKD